MDTYTVSFFGHRELDSPILIEEQLETIVLNLLSTKAYIEFLVGRDGDFGLLAASVIHRCKRTFRNDNSSLVWVMPYPTAEYRDNESAFRAYYDEIEICNETSGRHFKTAFQLRNRSMIDRSDLAVFYVQRKSTGAWKTLEYARKHGTPVICTDAAKTNLDEHCSSRKLSGFLFHYL